MACGPTIVLLGPADKRGGISWNQEIVSNAAEYALSIAWDRSAFEKYQCTFVR